MKRNEIIIVMIVVCLAATLYAPVVYTLVAGSGTTVNAGHEDGFCYQKVFTETMTNDDYQGNFSVEYPFYAIRCTIKNENGASPVSGYLKVSSGNDRIINGTANPLINMDLQQSSEMVSYGWMVSIYGGEYDPYGNYSLDIHVTGGPMTITVDKILGQVDSG